MKTQNTKRNILHITLLFGILVFVFPVTTNAARLYFETPATEVGVGQEMEITLYLDSQGEVVNALEGVITLPEVLSAVEVRDGDTLIPLWSERPRVEGQEPIIFGGLIPGGWKGTDGKIFSFIAKTNNQGVDAVVVSDAKVLLHDGHGSATRVTIEPIIFNVDELTLVTPISFDYYDDEAPEPFTPILVQDPDIFGGDYFLVFTAQDKESGIDRYEVQESKKVLKDEKGGEWQSVESPYRISDQRLESFVYIRAVDRADNIRVALFEPAEVPARSVLWVGYKILIIILIFLIIIIYRRRRRRNRFNRYRRF